LPSNFVVRGYTFSALFFFLGISLSYVLTCAFLTPPYFDVPRCTTLTSCLKDTGLPDDPYSRAVARSWYYVNKLRTSLAAREKICSAGLDMNNIVRQLSEIATGSEIYVVQAVKYADLSNYVAFKQLGYILDDLNRLGVQCVSDSKAHIVYTRVWDALHSTRRGAPSNPLATRLSSAMEQHKRLERAGLTVSALAPIFIPIVGSLIRWGILSYSSLVNRDNEQPSTHFGAEGYINASVGRYASVFYEYTSVLRDLHAARDELDLEARVIEADASNTAREIENVLDELRAINISGLSWERISPIASRAAEGAKVVADPSEIVKKTEIVVYELKYRITRDLLAYRKRMAGAYCYLSDARSALNDLQTVLAEIKSQSAALQNLRDACVGYIRSYNASSSYVRKLLPGYAKQVEQGDLGACADALGLIQMDKKYAGDETLLNSCENEAKTYDDYVCVGTVSEKLACCMAFLQKKRKILYTSKEYEYFTRMSDATEKMLALVGDDKDIAEFLSIASLPENGKELQKSVNDLVNLYTRLKKRVEKEYVPSFSVDGFLDAEQMSELNVTFFADVGDVDAEFSITLPFQAYSYRVLESKGMRVSVKGNEARIKGGGWAKVWVLAYPAEFDVKRMGEDGGKVYMRIAYEEDVPARYPLRGEVVSMSPSAYVAGGYIYFRSSGEAIVAEAALKQEWEREGNDLRVYLTNVSDYAYTGTLFLPISSRKIPRSCTPFSGGVVCSVNLRPFESKVLTFRDVNHMEEEHDHSIPEEAEEMVSMSQARVQLEGNVDKTAAFSYIDTLKKWYARAKELGIEQYIPFDVNTIDAVSAQLEETNDTSVVSTLTALLRSTVASTRRYIRSRVYHLRSVEGAEKAYALAKQALSSKDYMLALALALAADTEETTLPPVLPLLLSLFGLGGVGAYIRLRTNGTRKRRTFIPRI